MTMTGKATLVMLKIVAADTHHRYTEWFKQHPEEPYCYWARDDKEVITIADTKDPERLAQIMKEQPEVVDINHHATVRVEDNAVILENFCARLYDGLAEICEDGCTEFTRGGIRCIVSKATDKDNYIIKYLPE